MQYLHYIAGPLIGAIIGYFTNFLAVKMLFHPRTEKKLFGRTLPFTPGVIPKNKPRLAHAIGQAVANVLLTKEDIAGLLTDDTLNQASTALVAGSGVFSTGTVEDLARRAGIEDLNTQRAEDLLTDQIWESLQGMDFGGTVEQKARELLAAKPMLAFLPLDSILASVTGKVNEFVASEECRAKIAAAVHEKAEQMLHAPSGELLNSMNLSETEVEGFLSATIRKLADSGLEPLMERINIAGIIEEKINAMDVADFEDLVMSVMKNELNAIVNLGFFIGLIIGIVNIFI